MGKIRPLFLCLLLLSIFLFSAYGFNYFSVNETFDYGMFGNHTNSTIQYPDGNTSHGISLLRNMYNPRFINDSSFSSNKTSHNIYIRTRQGSYTIRNATGLNLNGQSLTFKSVNPALIHTTMVVINFTGCDVNDCYITPKTRISFNLSWENVDLNPAEETPIYGFIRKYYNNSARLNSPFYTYGSILWPPSTYDNVYTLGSVSYRTNDAHYLICNDTSLTNQYTYGTGVIAKYVNYTMGNLSDIGQGCNIDFLEPITGFIIGFHSESSSVNQSLDNLEILNIFNGTNQMPTVNISSNQSYFCVNFTDPEINVPLVYNAFDPENDTILYATQLRQLSTQLNFITFSRATCWLGICDVSLLSDAGKNFIYKDANTCRITNDVNLSNNFFLLDHNAYDDAFHGYLRIYNGCSGSDKSVYYDLQKSLNYLNFQMRLKSFSINESFNVTFYDALYNPIILTEFIWSADNKTLIYNYGPAKTLIANYTILDGLGYIGLHYQAYDNKTFNLYIENNTEFGGNQYNYYANPEYQKGDIRYMGITLGSNVTNGYIDLESGATYNYGYVFPTNFTSTPPSNISISRGKNIITLFYTDNFHLGHDYRIINLEIPMQSNNFCTDPGAIQPENEDLFTFNANGRTGMELKIAQFLWFIRFPYRFALYFGFLDVMQWAVTIAFIAAMALIYIRNQAKSGFMTLNNLVVVSFFVAALLFLIGLILTYVFVIVCFLFSVVAYNSVFNKQAQG